MAKLDMKRFAIQHVEKLIFGVVGLFCLYAIWGADWTPYRGTPREITDKVATSEKALKDHAWPESEIASYRLTNEQSPANVLHQRLVADIDSSKFPLPSKMSIDWFNLNEPVQEPLLLAAKAPLANSARAFLERVDLPAEVEVPQSPATGPVQQDDQPDVDDEFRRGTAARAAGSGVLGGDSRGGGNSPQEEFSASPEDYITDAMHYLSNEDRESMASSYDAISLAPKTATKGKGYSFVAFRALFPLRDQINNYMTAIHRSYDDAAALFQIVDCQVERREMTGRSGQWSEWSPVEYQIAEDILRGQNLQMDPVDSLITNPVITMPLPARITGEWRDLAKHPQIEKFELSEAQMDFEYEMNKIALLESAVVQKSQQNAPRTRTGGFSQFGMDNRQNVARMLGGRSAYGTMNLPGMGGAAAAGGAAPANADMDELVKNLAKYSGTNENKKQEELIKQWLRKQVDARGELLLIRYLDFGVQPGRTYSYRVRLVVSNPNFGQSLNAAKGMQHVIEGETRETPWSDPTEAIYVEPETHYFVKSVTEPSNKVFPVTNFDIFEWNVDKGTTVNASLPVDLGAYVGGEQKTKVIDAAKNILEEGVNYKFKSPDYLVDAASGIPIDRAFHSEATDGTGVRITSLLGGQLAIPPQSVVRVGRGELKYLSTPYQVADYSKRKENLARQEEQFASLVRPPSSSTLSSNLLNDNPDAENERGSRRRISGARSGRGPGSRRGAGSAQQN